MKRCSLKLLARVALAAALVLVSGAASTGLAQVKSAREMLPNLSPRLAATTPEVTAAAKAAEARLQQQMPGVQLDRDPLLGTPHFLRAADGFLTGPGGQGRALTASRSRAVGSPSDAHAPVKAFLDEYRDLFGHGAEALDNAKVTRESVNRRNQLRTVVWQQQVDNIPVFEAVLIANLSGQGELITLSSQFVADTAAAAEAGYPGWRSFLDALPVSPVRAIAAAAASVGDVAAENGIVAQDAADLANAKRQRFTSTEGTKGDVYVQLNWVPVDRNTLRLCWQVLLTSRSRGEMFLLQVDARTSEVLVRHCLTAYISDATYRVYTSDSPSPFTPGHSAPSTVQPPLVERQLITTNALDVIASPNGWINDSDNETRGNNVDAHLDRNDDDQPDLPRPQGNPNRVFDFTLDLTQEPGTYGDAAVVQLFYYNNWMHDRLYLLGFDEAAGNFQNDNFNRGGQGNDAINADCQDGLDLNDIFHDSNANMSTPPEGYPPRMQMYRFSGPTPDRDGDLDAEVMLHEHTHGLSNRRVGGGVGISTWQTACLGEGWSDFYPTVLLSEPSDDVNGCYPNGGYLTYDLAGLRQNYYFGIRRFPYSTDMTKNPLTFKDIDPTQASAHAGVPRNPIFGPFTPNDAGEVHNAGEVWCATLLDARAFLVGKHGFAGNELILQLVTDGLALCPPNPTYLQARDAILLADRLAGGTNLPELWRAFARRGMGFSAVAPPNSTTTGVVEAYDLPGLMVQSVAVSGGNGDAVIDVNECVDLAVALQNNAATPGTGISVSLSSPTPEVFIAQLTSTYPVIPVGGVATNLTPFKLITTPSFVCGSPIDLVFVIKSDAGTRTNGYRLATGSIGDPVRYDNNAVVGIPDRNANGASSVITVADFAASIGKAAVSVHITHTWVSDLRLYLVAPDGTTITLSENHGANGDNYGSGCSPDSSRTTFDDEATNIISGGAAPFRGTFRPEQPLSRLTGKSGAAVNGEWQLYAFDDFSGDVGAIQCWSLMLSPALCADGGGPCPGADLVVGMSDTPDPVVIYSNLVYTINVTNVGPNLAKGAVVTHHLPTNVTYLAAASTRGSVSEAGGIVTASLGNLPVGGFGTITVTVAPLAIGELLSSASIASTEPEINPPNNSASVSTIVLPPSADLSVSLSGTPSPTTLGGALSYTCQVINNGPVIANNVSISNAFPPTLRILQVTPSKGTALVDGNVVFGTVPSLGNGETATVTVHAIPLAEGTLVAVARVSSSMSDPLPANNYTTASVVVGPSADLAVSLIDQPDPVVISSNFSYLVVVANRGPSAAGTVAVSQTLPGGSYRVVSTSASQGSASISGKVLSWNVGSLAVGNTATLTVVGNSTNAETLTASATVTAATADASTGDNVATATTTVAKPFLSIVSAGAAISTESVSPPNGTIDANETVTVSFRLRNAGNVNNTNLVATLLASGGIIPVTTSQSYGVLPAGGGLDSRPFSFTASGTAGSTVTARLQLRDGPNQLPDVVFPFVLPQVSDFPNSTAIVIPDSGAAELYPSKITVSGVTGTVGRVSVTLSNMTHTFVRDVDMLLVGPPPLRQAVVLMSAAGGEFGVTNATFTLDDTAADTLPETDQILEAAVYRPASYNPALAFPTSATGVSAPAGPYAATLSTFSGVDPNGEWELYVADHTPGDHGSILSGWSLAVHTITPVNNLADLGLLPAVTPHPIRVGEQQTVTFTVTNAGPSAANGVLFTNRVPAGVELVSADASQGDCTVNGATVSALLGTLNAGASATVTLVLTPLAVGNTTNTAAVSAFESDLNTANNVASAVTAAQMPVADLVVSQEIASELPTPIVGSNITFTVLVENRGTNAALNTRLTNTLTAGLLVDSVTLSSGSYTLLPHGVVCNFGPLAPNAFATATLKTHASLAGRFTNTAMATTTSSLLDAANSTEAAAVTVTNARSIFELVAVKVMDEANGIRNGALEADEIVTLALSLKNVGQVGTTNLIATLQAANGVADPDGSPTSGAADPGEPQSYGVTVAGGASVTREFRFRCVSTPDSTITVKLALSEGGVSLNNEVQRVFTSRHTLHFTNASALVIPERGAAVPYPSSILVTNPNANAYITKVTATLHQFTHGFPSDVDVMLAGPRGQKLLLQSDAGGGWSVTNVTLNFEDELAAFLPEKSPLMTGSYKPTDYLPGDVFPSPAPRGERGTQLSTFNGTDPNGFWSLYVNDASAGDGGAIGEGWTLSLTIATPINPLANLRMEAASAPGAVFGGAAVTYTLRVTNPGPAPATAASVVATLPELAEFVSATAAQGTSSHLGGTVTFNLGTLAVGASEEMSIVLRPAAAGNATVTARASALETDLDPSDNTASAATVVTIVTPATLGGAYYDNVNNAFVMILTGQPGGDYALLASSDLVTWTGVATNKASSGGTIKFTDPLAPAFIQRYYRAVWLAP